jgi:hypothetical protein
MNTEHLFGLYLAKRRIHEADQRLRQAAATADAAAKARAAEREAAAQRVFDAIRDAAHESQIRARGRR